MQSRGSCLARMWGMGAVAAVAGLLVDVPEARACGGCFHEPAAPNQTVSTVITDHRMVFSISTTQTVLWDQIRYSGSPSGFAWVLPVKPGATIELSQDAWIASLDAATQTVIQGPSETCGGGPSTQDVGNGGGCGASSEAAGSQNFAPSAAGEDAGVSNVTVVSQEVVGPYDAVTVRSSQGEALGTWLRDNGYDVPTSLQPTIDAFANSGFDFIALKLAPGEGVQAMQPVRVVTQGAGLTLPLRMVAAGVGANVGIELYVLSEGRYHTQNFPDAVVDFSKLAWDPTSDVSNYTTLAAEALAQNGSRGWLTEMAGPASLGFQSGPNPPLDQAYASACVPQTLAPPASCDAGAGGNAATDGGTDGGTDANGTDAGAGAGDDAGTAMNVCQPQMVPCDDLTLATTGIPMGELWITRLRATLPASSLTADLILEASPSQDPMPSFHQTSQYTIANYNPCGSNANGASSNQSGNSGLGCMCRTPRSPSSRYADAIGLSLGLFVLGGIVRRRRRARGPAEAVRR
jgi:hypothetical protein